MSTTSWPPSHLRSERLSLRPPDFDDGPALHGVLNDPEVVRFLPYGPSATLAVTQHMIALWTDAASHGVVTYAVCPQGAERQPLGLVQVQHEPGSDEAELGVVLGRDAWGNGYAREAFRALRRAIPLGTAVRLHGGVDAQNARAVAMLSKIGLDDPGLRPGYRVHPALSAEPRACLLFQAQVVDGEIVAERTG